MAHLRRTTGGLSAVLSTLIFLPLTGLAGTDAPRRCDVAYYTGSIGPRLPVQITLGVDRADGNHPRHIQGTCSYDAVGAPVTLAGELKDGRAELTETDERGRIGGTFRGALDPTSPTLSLTFNAPAARIFDVQLTRVARREWRRFVRTDEIDVGYEFPCFDAQTPMAAALDVLLRAEVDREFNKDVRQFQAERIEAARTGDPFGHRSSASSITIAYVSRELISLRQSSQCYTGGAHGMQGTRGRNFAWVNGRLRELHLADLFRSDSRFVERLSTRCLADLTRKEASLVKDGSIHGFSEKDLGTFILAPSGLIIHFDPYIVGCYAEGSYEVEVPWPAIETMLADVPGLKTLRAARRNEEAVMTE